MIPGIKLISRAGINIQLSDHQSIIISGVLFLFGVYIIYSSVGDLDQMNELTNNQKSLSTSLHSATSLKRYAN